RSDEGLRRGGGLGCDHLRHQTASGVLVLRPDRSFAIPRLQVLYREALVDCCRCRRENSQDNQQRVRNSRLHSRSRRCAVVYLYDVDDGRSGLGRCLSGRRRNETICSRL
ncbi:hypothetical protein LTR17_003407, partial [Elasticomyces elasticus]